MDKRVYFDLSSLATTSAGSAVYAWELCHRLMRIAKPLQIIPLTCPFRTVGKRGMARTFNALLRDTLWNNVLAGREANEDDYFIFPNINVPPKFYKSKYAIAVLDLGAWHNRAYVTWRGKLSIQAMPRIIENADKIFAISDYTAQDIADTFGLVKDRVILAPCGLSDSYKLPPSPLKEINGVKIPNRYFLHVGTFEPKKNLPFLIKVYESFRELIGEGEEPIRLILTGGESWKNSELAKAVMNSPWVKDILIVGNVKSEELPSLYRGAMALIFPSIFEGFGLPVIEALSQSTPVLVNTNSSLTQFEEFGATLIDNFDVERWVFELKNIYEKRKRVDPEYVNKITVFFDWDRTARTVAETIGIQNL